MSEFEGEHRNDSRGSQLAKPASAPVGPSKPATERKFRPADWDDDGRGEAQEDGADEAAFKALTREEAQALVALHPPLSPWRVVGAQAAAGGLIIVLWWLGAWFAGEGVLGGFEKARSALCGVAAVVLPNALMAWGMTGLFRGIPGAAVLGFMFWELIKIMLAVAMLAAAAKWMPGLYWPALLVGLIGCLKVNWVALLLQGRFSKNRVAASHAKRDGN